MAAVNSFVPFGGLNLCTKCKERKTLDHFTVDRKRKSGLYSHCNPCRGRTHYSYVKGMTLSKREKTQLRLYGRFQSPNASCDICGGLASDIDHDHLTGATRGDLCRACNSLVGYLETRSHLLSKAHEYIERWNNGG